jgi:hypothetical protein
MMSSISRRVLMTALPTYYLFYSRYQTRSAQLSWLAGEVLPLLFVSAFFFDGSFVDLVPAYLLTRMAFVSLYEIGYIENDTVTIKHEPGAQSRLLAEDHRFFDTHYSLVIALKAAVMLASFVLLVALDRVRDLELNLPAFAVCLALTWSVFALHNRVRSRANIGTVLMLLWLKYGASFLLFARPADYPAAIGIALTLFPIAGTIEYASKPHFNLAWAIRINQDIDAFRVKYYLVLVVLTLIAAVVQPGQRVWPFLVMIAAYLLLYRIACLYMVRRRGYRRFKRNKTEA